MFTTFNDCSVCNCSVQMYSERDKFVQPAERELWDKVPVEAMSSEEDASDDNETFYHYSPSWRSDGITMFLFAHLVLCYIHYVELNDLIVKLNQRIEQHSIGKAARLKKKRIECPPRNCPAPFGLPQWMVKPCSECK